MSEMYSYNCRRFHSNSMTYERRLSSKQKYTFRHDDGIIWTLFKIHRYYLSKTPLRLKIDYCDRKKEKRLWEMTTTTNAARIQQFYWLKKWSSKLEKCFLHFYYKNYWKFYNSNEMEINITKSLRLRPSTRSTSQICHKKREKNKYDYKLWNNFVTPHYFCII